MGCFSEPNGGAVVLRGLFATVLLGTFACSPEASTLDIALLGPSGDEALAAVRIHFPEQITVIEGGVAPFVPAEGPEGTDGFELAKLSEGPLPVTAWLPQRADEAMRLSFRDGFEIRVREEGAEADGTLVNGMVTYRRAGGTSFWHATGAGVEEWLYLPSGSSTEEVATWRVEGGTLRQHGRAVDIYDAVGKPRVTVAAPIGYAANGSTVPVRLSARGDSVVLSIDSPRREALFLDPVWVPAGSMAKARRHHTSTLLPSGRVLIAAGEQGAGSTVLSHAELYDPVTGTWTTTTPMLQARTYHTATLLTSGGVLCVGGSPSSVGKTAEIYDEINEAWIPTSPLNKDRGRHTTTLLLDGRVMVTGDNIYPPSSEIFDPATNDWALAGQPVFSRVFHSAILLPSGLVLVAGGSPNQTTAELYDPANDLWLPAASMQIGRTGFPMAVLPSGNAIAVGGYNTVATRRAEEYDEASDTWTQTAPMQYARYVNPGLLMPDGSFLAIGGLGSYLGGASYTELDLTERYDPVADTWAYGPAMIEGRAVHAASLLPNNRILVSGGSGIMPFELATAEILSGIAASGAQCLADNECTSLHCVDGLCCDVPCNHGSCDACSMSAGATVDGTCTLLTGVACNDGDSCTTTDVCENGGCVGSAPVLCPQPEPCRDQGACDPATGICDAPFAPNGTRCSEGECQSGACVPLRPAAGGGGAGGESSDTSAGGSAGTKPDGGSGGTGAHETGSNPQPYGVVGGCGCRVEASKREPPPHDIVWLLGAALARCRRSRPLSSNAAPGNRMQG